MKSTGVSIVGGALVALLSAYIDNLTGLQIYAGWWANVIHVVILLSGGVLVGFVAAHHR